MICLTVVSLKFINWNFAMACRVMTELGRKKWSLGPTATLLKLSFGLVATFYACHRYQFFLVQVSLFVNTLIRPSHSNYVLDWMVFVMTNMRGVSHMYKSDITVETT